MLNKIIIAFSLFVSFQAESHTYELGYIPIPGACVLSDYANRSPFPLGNKESNIRSSDGQQKISILVLPTKIDSDQSDKEKAVIESCVVETYNSIRNELAYEYKSLEQKFTSLVNACLTKFSTSVRLQFSIVKKSEIICPHNRNLN